MILWMTNRGQGVYALAVVGCSKGLTLVLFLLKQAERNPAWSQAFTLTKQNSNKRIFYLAPVKHVETFSYSMPVSISMVQVSPRRWLDILSHRERTHKSQFLALLIDLLLT